MNKSSSIWGKFTHYCPINWILRAKETCRIRRLRNDSSVNKAATLKEIKNQSAWKSELELKAQCSERIKQLAAAGAPIEISSSALESVLGSALEAINGRGLLDEKDNLYRLKESEIEIISYYANSIAHW